MASIGSLLKDEITRLSRKEIRRQVEPFRKASATHRRHIAALKRDIAALQRKLAALGKGRARPAASEEAETAGAGTRFVAKGLKTLRARLGLSAADFGRLVGVSGQSVYNWESKKAVPRRAQVAAIAALRPLGKREVQQRLDALPAAVGTAPTRAKKAVKATRKRAATPARKTTRPNGRKAAATPTRKRAAKAASKTKADAKTPG